MSVQSLNGISILDNDDVFIEFCKFNEAEREEKREDMF